MKKILISLMICIFLIVSLVGTVLALTPYEKKVYSKITDFIPKLKYAFEKGFFLFTSWGQANDCSVYPDKEKWIEIPGFSETCQDNRLIDLNPK